MFFERFTYLSLDDAGCPPALPGTPSNTPYCDQLLQAYNETELNGEAVCLLLELLDQDTKTIRLSYETIDGKIHPLQRWITSDITKHCQYLINCTHDKNRPELPIFMIIFNEIFEHGQTLPNGHKQLQYYPKTPQVSLEQNPVSTSFSAAPSATGN